jgi:hypothetical protein
MLSQHACYDGLIYIKFHEFFFLWRTLMLQNVDMESFIIYFHNSVNSIQKNTLNCIAIAIAIASSLLLIERHTGPYIDHQVNYQCYYSDLVVGSRRVQGSVVETLRRRCTGTPHWRTRQSRCSRSHYKCRTPILVNAMRLWNWQPARSHDLPNGGIIVCVQLRILASSPA